MSETIFDVLRADHDKLRTLTDLVEKTHGDSDGRRELFARLEAEARAHAALEERLLYAPLLGDESTRERAGHSVEEHREMNRLFDELSEADRSSPGWVQRFQQLAEAMRHHLDEEEREMFPQAGRVLTAREKEEMARRFQAEKPAEKDAVAG
ncbi:MAG TPA: hemerythrin domain-containing protein [Polyangiaceae bacterium LLY-WYZ-14_1]|jgi:iron-sulfur cluster repair protein YtfE (RIC family)|nr:hemerythrin domain-containing protein [Polyangiaceae bacterium LLY-WYZ-14_1]